MAIFPNLNIENIVQTHDTIRLDATRSVASKDEAAISLVEIEPESGSGFIDVTGSKAKDWFLDWQYAGASRTVTVSVRVTTDGVPVTSTFDLEVITPADDKLFSNDGHLLEEESDILKFLPDGKSSFNWQHRKAQKLIIKKMNDDAVEDYDRNKITKDAFVDITEVQEWSAALTLALIFKDNSNVVNDNYAIKSNDYFSIAAERQQRAFFRLDLNGNGTIETGERSQFQTKDLVRT